MIPRKLAIALLTTASLTALVSATMVVWSPGIPWYARLFFLLSACGYCLMAGSWRA